jgi:hypothetical protein
MAARLRDRTNDRIGLLSAQFDGPADDGFALRRVCPGAREDLTEQSPLLNFQSSILFRLGLERFVSLERRGIIVRGSNHRGAL